MTQIMNEYNFFVNKCIIKMSNKAKDTDINNGTYYFFNNINIKFFDPDNIKTD